MAFSDNLLKSCAKLVGTPGICTTNCYWGCYHTLCGLNSVSRKLQKEIRPHEVWHKTSVSSPKWRTYCMFCNFVNVYCLSRLLCCSRYWGSWRSQDSVGLKKQTMLKRDCWCDDVTNNLTLTLIFNFYDYSTFVHINLTTIKDQSWCLLSQEFFAGE